MGFLHSKKFWLTTAHVGIFAGSIAGAILFPPFAPIIIGTQAAAHGLIPSPFAATKPA
jgi:hypothetical protein